MPRLSPLTYTLALVLVCYGLVLFTFGPCLTAIAETFGVPLGRTGLIFTFCSVGLLPSVVLSGFLSERLGKRPVILAGVVLLGAGCALFAASPALGSDPRFAYALAAMVVFGIGAGSVESAANALIADDNQPSPAFALNFTHAFFAVGAVVGPVAAGMLLRFQLPWQFAFYGGAALVVVVLPALAAQRPRVPRGDPMGVGEWAGLLRSALLWLLLIVLAMYVGAEVGLSAWVSPLMEEVLGASRGLAAMAVSAFWGCMIVGRLATSHLSTRMRTRPLILGLAGGSVVGGVGGALAPTIGSCLVLSGVSGLFMSGMFGMVATDASRYFPDRSGAVFGLLVFGVGIGALVVPAAMGWVATVGDLRLAMLIPPALMSVVVIAYLLPWSECSGIAAGRGHNGKEERGS